MYNAPYQGVANQLSQYGRFGDSQLVHMNPIEVQMLARMSPTGQLTRNPQTGQPEAFLPFLAPLLGSFLGSSLLTGAGAGLIGAAGLSSAAAGAIGSGLATTLATGDLEQGIMSGITGFGIGSALGGLGAGADAATKAATETATQGATQAAADAATSAVPFTPPAANFPATPGIPSTESLLAEAATGTPIDALNFNVADLNVQPLSAGTPAFGAPQSLGRLAGMSPQDLLNLPAPPPTAAERFAAPFQQPGQFFSELAKPGSFLPVYVGETGRMAREAELAGSGTARAFEEEQEAEKARIRGQMADVFNQVRAAYPGIGYATGGMVEGYAEGGPMFNQDIYNSLRFSSLPVAENVQLSLRGSEFVPPPAASYSALDVGGEGYLPGVSPEFQYFRNPVVAPPDTTTPPEGQPAGPDMGGFRPDSGFNLEDFMSRYGAYRGMFGGTPAGPPAGTPADGGPRGRGDDALDGMDFTGGGPRAFDEPDRFDTGALEELLGRQFNPLQERLGQIESRISEQQPVANQPQFDYDRIPTPPSYDFSALESRIDALANRPTPEFDYSRIPSYQPIDLSGLESRLAAIESRPMPEFDYNRIPSYSPPDLSGLESKLAGIENRFQNLPAPQVNIPEFDLSPIQQQIADLQSGIGALQSRPVPTFDVSGLESRLGGLESRLSNMPAPIVNAPAMDLSGIESRLAAIEGRGSPQISFDPIMERLSSLENLISSQRMASPSQSMPSFNKMEFGYGFAEGGMTGDSAAPAMAEDNGLVEMTIAAIRGEIENGDQIISRFVEMYGPDVFMKLREQILQEIVPGAQTEGMVDGEGGGQDDLVEGMIGTQRPVAVSPGEYIIPADVVALAGGGYSGDGASFFDGLVDDIRQKTMGTTEQVKPYRRAV